MFEQDINTKETNTLSKGYKKKDPEKKAKGHRHVKQLNVNKITILMKCSFPQN